MSRHTDRTTRTTRLPGARLPGALVPGALVLGALVVAGAAVAIPGVGVAAGPRPAAAVSPWGPCADASSTVTNGQAANGQGAGTGATGSIDETRLATFRLLAEQPSLTIELPTAGNGAAGGSAPRPMVQLTKATGGLLVWVTAGETDTTGTAIAFVQHDGAVRWTACLPTDVTSVDVGTAGAQGVITSFDRTPERRGKVQVIDLATGRITDDLTDQVTDIAGGVRLLATTAGGAFFGYPYDTSTSPTHLARVDLNAGTVASRPLPPAVSGDSVLEFTATPSGYLTVWDSQSPLPVDAALVDGRWTTDTARIDRIVGPLVDFSYHDEFATLARLAADGSTMWERNDLRSSGREGFSSALTDGVVLANSCGTEDPMTCVGSLVGVDANSGKTLWSLLGMRGVSEVANGLALTTDGDSAVMIDARTGQAVPGSSRWPSDTFANECCGEGDYVYTRRLGAMVAAVNGSTVRVYYPADVAPAGSTVHPFG